jgi:hypothetical protein
VEILQSEMAASAAVRLARVRSLELISAKPAVDRNDRTGNVACLRRGEEHGKRREILRFTPIADRNLLFGKLLPIIFRIIGGESARS